MADTEKTWLHHQTKPSALLEGYGIFLRYDCINIILNYIQCIFFLIAFLNVVFTCQVHKHYADSCWIAL